MSKIEIPEKSIVRETLEDLQNHLSAIEGKIECLEEIIEVGKSLYDNEPINDEAKLKHFDNIAEKYKLKAEANSKRDYIRSFEFKVEKDELKYKLLETDLKSQPDIISKIEKIRDKNFGHDKTSVGYRYVDKLVYDMQNSDTREGVLDAYKVLKEEFKF